MSVGFHLIAYNRAPWAGNNRYTKKMTFAFILDNFVYVFGPESEYLEKVKVEGVFQDPRKISEFVDSHSNLSYDPDKDEYPLSTSMADLIKQQMLAINMQPFIQSFTDQTNNSQSDPQPNTSK